MKPSVAKKSNKILTEHRLIKFIYNSKVYPIEPKTAFYDWIYCKALEQHKDFTKQIIKYSAFTDVEFNEHKSINCQARSAAIFVSLLKRDLLEKALQDFEKFKNIVYDKNEIFQLKLDI